MQEEIQTTNEEIETITITVLRPTWKELMRIKIDEDIKTLDEVITNLLKKRKENGIEK